ncbi:uncharacterized protein LOC121274305 isoform X2 [Carcharodon carcharias]|uniref:uncharacterized protein LOC121274305 isoform X2 n=1 Tax=Carcharodon carcharias TaxID=13397 RepID=UPI001B7E1372|nr:uncharacterized protein LOC121274305 isoform X2 [Carcharodon carcharias]
MFCSTDSALVVILCIAVGLGAGPILIQSPEVVKVSEGKTVQLHCALKSRIEDDTVEKYTVHWYHPQNKSHIILSHFVTGGVYRSKGLSKWIQPSRDFVNNGYTLTIRDVQLNDTNVYICGIWGRIFGNGTLLNVTSANAPVLIQSPSLERVTEGHTAQLQCTMRNAAVRDTDAHWYRELPEKDMEWVLTYDIKNITRWSPGFTERFQPFRDTSNNSFILTITNVQPSDTAVYYCKVWGDISGNGTRLNITISNARMAGELKIVWISVGAALGALLIVGAALLFWVCPARTRKRQSSCSLHTGDNALIPDYANISPFRNTERADDLRVDSNLIYENVSSQNKDPSQ